MNIKNIEYKITLEDGRTLTDGLSLNGYTEDVVAIKAIDLIPYMMKRSYNKVKEEE